MLQMLFRWYFQIPIYLRLLLTVIFFMFLFGSVMHFVEPVNFPSLFDGLWWAFVTGSTVGYGDFVPNSILGKVIGILMILAGGGIVTYYMVTVASGAVEREKEMDKGNVAYKGKDHVVLIGWNERSRQLLNMINDFKPTEEVVLVDHSLSKSPKHHYHFHFVQGDASLDNTLKKANIPEARHVIITSDQSRPEKQADQLAILSTIAVRGVNPEVPISTEILTKNQIPNAERAGANTVIRSNDFMSTLFFHEVYRAQPVKPFDIMLEQLASQQYNQHELPEEQVGRTFLECSNDYVKKDELLLGIIRKGDVLINPPFQMDLEIGDQLIVLVSLRE
ncbi:potassium channel family protein [Virgibacillus sp. MSP4-1]|uniref:potassium channel family protein n=1 Tax=Virgibacillus sp. MSP4-1 TaxID=2700081 RepID=UPI0005C518A2|nr:potassium channel family protein [Virgibacillus sp. MSP4-1]QHS23108.1 potassium channel family protein [Virgibacillus sp. MSP4-1]